MFFDVILPLLFVAACVYLGYRAFKKEIAREERNRKELLESINGISHMIGEHTDTVRHMCLDLEKLIFRNR